MMSINGSRDRPDDSMLDRVPLWMRKMALISSWRSRPTHRRIVKAIGGSCPRPMKPSSSFDFPISDWFFFFFFFCFLTVRRRIVDHDQLGDAEGCQAGDETGDDDQRHFDRLHLGLGDAVRVGAPQRDRPVHAALRLHQRRRPAWCASDAKSNQHPPPPPAPNRKKK